MHLYEIVFLMKGKRRESNKLEFLLKKDVQNRKFYTVMLIRELVDIWKKGGNGVERGRIRKMFA